MLLFLDFRFWLLGVLAGIWIHRVLKARQTLLTAPSVQPGFRWRSPDTPLVSVIIPAKNEERNIRDCLEALLVQDYPNYEIIVANDSSTDRTETILQSFGDRITYVNVSPTPKGWTGKNFAIHSAMGKARGEWYLFTDADTRHAPQSISASLSHARTRKLAFLTLIPKCLTHGFFENVIQPCVMGFIGLWFPLDKINDPHSHVYFGNGQYILMTAELHRTIGGHETVADQYLEDFALMRHAKELWAKAECALATDIYGTRMYHAFSFIWRGWRRICLHAFEKNIPRLTAKAADVFICALLPFVLLPWMIAGTLAQPADHQWILGLLVVILGLILFVVQKVYSMMQAKRVYALFFPFAALTLVLILVNAVWIAATGKHTKWR